MDDRLKAPPLTKDTTILSFDVETNGFHGSAFAVGAVLMKADGSVLDEFEARAPIEGEVDQWVAENVLPAIKDLKQNYKTQKAMRNAFWEWFTLAQTKSNYVLVNNGYPAEARFLIACQDDDLKARYMGHPFPLLELNSLLLQAGIKPLAHKLKLVEDQIAGTKELQHHPRFDAWVAALAAFKAMTLAGRLKP